MNWRKLFNLENKEETFIDAEEALRKSLNYRKETKEEYKHELIKRIQRNIKDDIKVSGNQDMCIVEKFKDSRSKAVLPEVAEYFASKGYEIELFNNENYEETNILIINWQGKEIFQFPDKIKTEITL